METKRDESPASVTAGDEACPDRGRESIGARNTRQGSDSCLWIVVPVVDGSRASAESAWYFLCERESVSENEEYSGKGAAGGCDVHVNVSSPTSSSEHRVGCLIYLWSRVAGARSEAKEGEGRGRAWEEGGAVLNTGEQAKRKRRPRGRSHRARILGQGNERASGMTSRGMIQRWRRGSGSGGAAGEGRRLAQRRGRVPGRLTDGGRLSAVGVNEPRKMGTRAYLARRVRCKRREADVAVAAVEGHREIPGAAAVVLWSVQRRDQHEEHIVRQKTHLNGDHTPNTDLTLAKGGERSHRGVAVQCSIRKGEKSEGEAHAPTQILDLKRCSALEVLRLQAHGA
ncbi:hypothetical protein B0H13DRAFT_1907031 [Mycena leptocephala]|nr:hypothetical protein B0H13DRAFT_1908436 [Mycena leptocephala]KAJ7847875.1 hypothetical protein B0H13DRAFT_1907031 [Mycena leptocephala]